MPSKQSLDYRPLSPERRSAILQRTLAEGPGDGSLRVFAYGSLMWNPCFEALEALPADVKGYRRQFCILTVRARGTPECPGLGPALVPGEGACRGIAYTLNPESQSRDLDALFEREMNTGVYRPTWVEAETGARRSKALAFVVEPAHQQYCGRLELAEMAEIIAGATGSFGSCRDYLASMLTALERIGGAEPDMKELLQHVDARLGRAASR